MSLVRCNQAKRRRHPTKKPITETPSRPSLILWGTWIEVSIYEWGQRQMNFSGSVAVVRSWGVSTGQEERTHRRGQGHSKDTGRTIPRKSLTGCATQQCPRLSMEICSPWRILDRKRWDELPSSGVDYWAGAGGRTRITNNKSYGLD